MGGSSKNSAKRRKEQMLLAKKAKRERKEKALSSLAAFAVPSKQLDQLDRGMAREGRRKQGQSQTHREQDVTTTTTAASTSAPLAMEVPIFSGDLCGLDALTPIAEKTKPAADSKTTTNNNKKKRKQDNDDNSNIRSPQRVKPRHQEQPQQIATKGKEEGEAPAEEEEDCAEEIIENPNDALAQQQYLKALHVKSGQFVIHVSRDEGIQQARASLPICAQEQEIMEAINYNSIVVVCGETGSGKTTQIPQFLYEAGYGTGRTKGQVGVTQPRRIAASSTAQRVAQELSSNLGDIVGYQVRYDKKVGANTKLKFMTDGILMRELQEDALLRKYSVIVLDEVHERNLNTDVILGFLTRIIPLRAKLAASPDSGVEELKLLIMSATLSSKEFVENKRLFSKQPPVISVPAKRYPVTVHFSRKTELHSYLHVAYKKVCAIHRKLPNGGVLVFVTGQREVQYLTKRLQKGLCRKKTEAAANNKNKNKENDENDKEKRGNGAAAAESNEEEGQEWLNPFDGDAAEDFSSSEEDESEGEEGRGVDEGEGSDVESEEENKEELPGTLVALNGTTQSQEEEEEKKDGASLDALVIPLYAKLGPELQERAFSKPPPNCRLIIIATNVAETSITIPGIRYVVDAGRSKQKTHKSVDSGLTQFEVNWISKSSATQRAGRAGRTGPGHCYRLFSSAFYNDKFPQFSVPDIKNTPLEAVVLQLKSIGVDKSESFPFPTQPNPDSLSKAERCLRLLNMVSSESGQINGLGSFLSKFPINPRHARMLVASVMLCNSPRLLGKCLQVAISVAAILSFEDPVNHQETGESNKKHANSKKGKQEKHKQQQQQQDPDDILSAGNLRSTAQRYGGDVFATLTILRAYEEQAESDASRLYTFCNKNRLHVTVIREIVQLKRQLASICASRVSSSSQEEEYSDLQEFSVLRKAVNDAGDQKGLQGVTPKPNAQVATILQHAICVGWADRVARRITVREMVEEREGRNQIRATHKMKKRYQTLFGDSLVSLRKKSAISHNRPEFVVYRDLIQGRTNTYMECVTEVHPSWLSDILKPISTFSSPLEEPEPFYDAASDKCYCWVHPSVGRHDWSLPICKIEAHDKAIRCRAFLAALLSGKVFPQLSASLEVPASWDHHPAVVLATKSLEKYNVSTKKAFERALNLKKGFLFDELKLMAKKNQREGFAKFWDSYA